MWAGGLPRIPYCGASVCQGDNAGDVDQWWNDNVHRISTKTWTATDWMNRHFSQYQGSRYRLNGTAESLQGGDVLLMQLPGNSIPSHARVIVGWGTSWECVWCASYPLGSSGLMGFQAGRLSGLGRLSGNLVIQSFKRGQTKCDSIQRASLL
jgi:hypothetical protein